VRNPERILIVRLSHLGDVVHALGVFHALHAAYPAAEIGWAIQREFAELVTGLPGLARVIPFERRGGPLAWVRLGRELRGFRPDWAVDAQGNAKSGWAALLSAAPRRTAPARSDWQEPWAAWTANDRARALAAPARHAMQRMAELAAHVAPGTCTPLRTDAALSPTEVRAGAGALEQRLPRRAAGTVLLHLSTSQDVRGWPAGHWAGLIRSLRASGRSVLALSGPAEAAVGGELSRRLAPDDGLSHWVGQRGLRQLAAVFRAAAGRGLTLVACDSGPMHLAAAHGLPVVALEGPQDAARTGPWPLPSPTSASREEPRHRTVRARLEPDCAPCFARRCRHPEGAVCMLRIEPEDVLAALEPAE
jgi:ADP-heptose:LPS heptosyltransferase